MALNRTLKAALERTLDMIMFTIFSSYQYSEESVIIGAVLWQNYL